VTAKTATEQGRVGDEEGFANGGGVVRVWKKRRAGEAAGMGMGMV
jgi:hypothetical protein